MGLKTLWLYIVTYFKKKDNTISRYIVTVDLRSVPITNGPNYLDRKSNSGNFFISFLIYRNIYLDEKMLTNNFFVLDFLPIQKYKKYFFT
jgi:hypothetical protein